MQDLIKSSTLKFAFCAAVFTALPIQAKASGCLPIAQAYPEIQIASLDQDAFWQMAAIPNGASVELRYLGHSSYAIQTSDGTKAVTDYYGLPLQELPNVATMNNAHSTHYTPFPDPAIEHVLQGWGENNEMATHNIEVGDLKVRNVPTSVHGRTGSQTNSNSIFVFEVSDMCIAHLGHLHHMLEDVHLAELGLIDIVMAPIDGAYTMSQAEMARVIEQINPSVVLPMHYFGNEMLARFAALLGDKWSLEVSAEPTVAFSRTTLPYRQILVLPMSKG